MKIISCCFMHIIRVNTTPTMVMLFIDIFPKFKRLEVIIPFILDQIFLQKKNEPLHVM